MPDEIPEVQDTGQTEEGDPLESARAEDVATEEATAAEKVKVPPPVAAVPIEEGAGGVSDELKHIKAELTRKTAALYKAQTQINRIVPILQGRAGADPKVPVTPEQAEEILKSFVKDPHGHLDGRIKEIVGELLKTEIDPLRGELSGSRADSAISAFMRDHPELGEKGEERIGAILDANPHMTALGKNPSAARIKSSLEDALGRLIAADPKGYAASLEAAKTGVDQNIQDAKNAAGGLGNKTGSAVTTPQTNRDEFDAVLDLNAHKQERYASGS